MPGGEQGDRGAPSPAAGRSEEIRARRSRGAAALIDAVFPADDSTPAAAGREDSPQTLLTHAVEELARRSGAERSCAWLATEAGGFTRVAEYGRSQPLPSDDLEPGAFEVLRRLTRATDLGDRLEEPTAARVSDASGISAAVALGRRGGQALEPALAVLALGGPEDALGSVRPRTLAVLQELAQQLDAPLATLAAVQQIRGLGQDIRWLDRQAALGAMLGEIIHEVRNPLVSVKTFLELLPDRLDDLEFLDGFRAVVLGEVARLERLLDSVLSHSQPERIGDTARGGDVAAALETLAGLLAHRAGEKQIHLVCQAEPDAGRVEASPDVLQQVLLNLTLNALGATPPGGEVRVRAYPPAVAKGHWIELTVEDTGPGIPVSERERVFEPFTSSRGHGPGGLGLAICQRLVEEAGGEITVSDAAGGGARLVVRLPGDSEEPSG
jgi:signal transduction histidine kinase